jgi:hypothetical protein
LSEPKSAASVSFKAQNGSTSEDGFEIALSLNKDITSSNAVLQASEFTVKVDGNTIPLQSVRKDSALSNVLILKHNTELFSVNEITVSYNGTSVNSSAQPLDAFTNLVIKNNLPLTHTIPGKIEAEAFSVNKGFALEDCSDQGGGKNTSYASPDDYLDYRVHVAQTGIYQFDYRVASQHTSAEIILQLGDGESFTAVDTLTISGTGGWQTWETQSASVRLEEGYHFVRILVLSGEYNLNWFNFQLLTSTGRVQGTTNFQVYPNPVSRQLNIQMFSNIESELALVDMHGRLIFNSQFINSTSINVSDFRKGMYFLRVDSGDKRFSQKVIVQ